MFFCGVFIVGSGRTDYISKYQKENYRRVNLKIRFRAYDLLKKCAELAGCSVSAYIKRAIAHEMLRQLTGTEHEPDLVLLAELVSSDDS